jgi:hypothetical protein
VQRPPYLLWGERYGADLDADCIIHSVAYRGSNTIEWNLGDCFDSKGMAWLLGFHEDDIHAWHFVGAEDAIIAKARIEHTSLIIQDHLLANRIA